MDIKEVIASKSIKENKSGYWKAQLNLLNNNKYMIEIYYFPYYLENDNNKYYSKIYDNESKAEKVYQNIKIGVINK